MIYKQISIGFFAAAAAICFLTGWTDPAWILLFMAIMLGITER